MRFDIENELATSQAFTGAATVTTNSYKKGSAAQDIAIGRRMALLWYFHLTGAGTSHLLEAIQSTAADLGTSVDALSSITVSTAQATAEKFHELSIPPNVMTKQYLGGRHTATGGTTTATLSCWLVPQDEIAKYKSFPKVVNSEA
jgi:hypothetical protein